MSDAIKALARNMVSRKKSEVEPYVLFLGAGASVSSGCSNMMKIVNDVLKSHDEKQFNDWQSDIDKATSIDKEYGELLKGKIEDKKRDRFYELWGKLDRDTQYSILREHLWINQEPSSGYKDLVSIIKKGHIKLVLSTNLDNLLEKALNNAGLYAPDDFIVIVNGKDKPEEIVEQLESSRSSLKLVKLHGTLESPNSYAFTSAEVFDFEKKIKPSLSRILNKSSVIVGYSMQDRDIDVLFEEEGKEIYLVKPSRPEAGSKIWQILSVRGKGNLIYGDNGKFDLFFKKLHFYINTETKDNDISDSTPSIERFLQIIGYEHELEVPRSRYKNLTTLYVKPNEYDDICSKLEKDHIVFIIGEPHLGKTYTAIYLLWEYYQNGYETLHIRHDKLVTLLHENESNTEKLLLSLISGKEGRHLIIHFDDPFGETMERRTDEFAKGLNSFLDLGRKYESLRIIVTTRLNIFRESLEKQDFQNIEELERDLRIHTSYHPEVLLDILHRYIRFYEPLWSSDERIIWELNKKLPKLLPAPHNIEFFVRTSERLTALDDVIYHVNKSKEMIRALGEWMASLPDHEQLFLTWVEICSTANILFSGKSASKVSLEDAYRETLAYMFKRKQIPGIPTNSFSRSKDKFDMILFGNVDQSSKLVKFDFVHPSYHEAFWYAIEKDLRLFYWWKILNGNIGEILRDLDNKVDLFQLRLIENYGTTNRDLDKLLIKLAESDNIEEKIIALEHMMERFEIFSNLPIFSKCVHHVILSDEPRNHLTLLNLFEEYFYQLSPEIFNLISSYFFNDNKEIRTKANDVMEKYYSDLNYFSNEFPPQLKECEAFKIWKFAKNLKVFEYEMFVSRVLAKNNIHKVKRSLKNKSHFNYSIGRFTRLTPGELRLLFKNEFNPSTFLILLADGSWDKLSLKKKKIIKSYLMSKNYDKFPSVEFFVINHFEEFYKLSSEFPFVQDVKILKASFGLNVKPDEDIITQFENVDLHDWSKIKVEVIRKLMISPSSILVSTVYHKVLKNTEYLTREQNELFLRLIRSPSVKEKLSRFDDIKVEKNR